MKSDTFVAIIIRGILMYLYREFAKKTIHISLNRSKSYATFNNNALIH